MHWYEELQTPCVVHCINSCKHHLPLLTSPAPLFAPHAEDPLLPLGYTAESVVEGKAAAKAELRKRMQLSNAGERLCVCFCGCCTVFANTVEFGAAGLAHCVACWLMGMQAAPTPCRRAPCGLREAADAPEGHAPV